MLTILWFIYVNIVDQKKKLLTIKFEWKNPKWPLNSPSYKQETKWLYYLCLEIAYFFIILYDLGPEKNISGVYCSSSDR